MRSMVRFLLVVMLLTVLAPKFGWDAVSAVAPHAHAGEAVAHVVDGEECHGHHGHGGEHPGIPVDGHPDHGNHCCPGHVLGHMFGSVPAIVPAQVPSDPALVLAAPDARFSSRIPEGLERPPKAAA
jgi:hypothetical protein